MAFVKIWIHAVWSVKNREPLLSKSVRTQLFTHIRENAASKNIHVNFINGYIDHIHCLISLNPEQSIAKTIQLIKGESSFWMNRNKVCPSTFEWQDEYFAVSVSESKLESVRQYIKNQEAHHRSTTYQQEHDAFILKYEFDRMINTNPT